MANGMETVMSCTVELSCTLSVEFADELPFYSREKYLNIHPADMNPSEKNVLQHYTDLA